MTVELLQSNHLPLGPISHRLHYLNNTMLETVSSTQTTGGWNMSKSKHSLNKNEHRKTPVLHGTITPTTKALKLCDCSCFTTLKRKNKTKQVLQVINLCFTAIIASEHDYIIHVNIGSILKETWITPLVLLSFASFLFWLKFKEVETGEEPHLSFISVPVPQGS